MVRKFEGVFIPMEVWLAKDLSWIEKLVITEYKSWHKGAKPEYLAHFFEININECKRIISNAKSKNLI